jgi:hypothetical protein
MTGVQIAIGHLIEPLIHGLTDEPAGSHRVR